jgi:hypothetical protein
MEILKSIVRMRNKNSEPFLIIDLIMLQTLRKIKLQRTFKALSKIQVLSTNENFE